MADSEVVINPSFAVFNPHNKPIGELPVIYGFNNGGSPGWYNACLIAEDGMGLGGHICSSEFYMYYDLGIISGYRLDRHEGFQKHYPDGYRMDFVSFDHPAIVEAIRLNNLLPRPKVPEGDYDGEVR